jgi:Rrf2 family protein
MVLMRVSARADYALRVAIELAAASDRHVTGEQLARAQDIPDKFLETILTHLRRTSIVRSQRGPDGGFWLARPASEISLADIIRAVDGQPLSVRGEPGENATYPGPAEPLRRVWIALRAFGPSVLETLTLADIVSGELWLCLLAGAGLGTGPAPSRRPRTTARRRQPAGGRHRPGPSRMTTWPGGPPVRLVRAGCRRGVARSPREPIGQPEGGPGNLRLWPMRGGNGGCHAPGRSRRPTPPRIQYFRGFSGTSAGDTGRHCGTHTRPGSVRVKPSNSPAICSRPRIRNVVSTRLL